MTTNDPTTGFFAGLSTRAYEPLLDDTNASVRFDVVDGDDTDHWLLRITAGALEVEHANGEADCVITSQRAAFDRLATGGMNPMAALLRGAIVAAGDPRLVVRVQRLFPAPTGMPEAAAGRDVGKRRS